MDANWAPVVFVAVIVIGVVGGSLGMAVLKELLPLLRTIAEQKTQLPTGDAARLAGEVKTLAERVERLEADQQTLNEANEFMRRLIAERR